MKIVINKCHGGFGLSDLAYEKLIEYGIPVKKYIREKRNSKTGRYDLNENGNEKVIYDRELSDKKDEEIYWKFKDIEERYWEIWLSNERDNKLLIKVVEELKEKANNRFSKLKIVEIPDNVEWEIDDYNGLESVEEKHKSWY